MSLQIWLPLNKQGDFTNRGVGDMSIVSNNAQYNNEGKIGGCVLCSSSQRLTLKCQDWFKFNPSTKFSVALWIKGCTNDGWLFACNSWEMVFRTNTIQFYPGPSGINPVYWNTTVDPNRWYHICGTWDGHKSCLYVDGELKCTTEIPNTATFYDFYDHKNFYLTWSNTSYLNDFRLYDHALSQKEVKEISQGLVVHHKLNDICGKNLFVFENRKYTQDNPYVWTSASKDALTTECRIKALDLVPGKTYTFSCCTDREITSSHDSTIGLNKVSLWFYLYPTNNVTYSYPSPGTHTLFASTSFWSYKEEGCNRYSWRYTIPEGYQACCVRVNHYSDGTNAITSKYWDFKLEEGDTYTPDMWDGVSYDSSGYNNDGTITGDFTMQGDSPRYDKCVKCNGVNNILLKNPLYNYYDSFTFAFWYKHSSDNKQYNIITSNGSTTFGQGTPHSGWWISCKSEGSSMWVYLGQKYITSNPSIDNNWHHWVVTYTKDDTTNNYKLYLDGVLQNTSISSVSGYESKTPTFSEYLMIGGEKTYGGFYYNQFGNISDFRIYATALSAEDVKDLYETSASIDNRGTLHAREIVENTENIFRVEDMIEENFYPDNGKYTRLYYLESDGNQYIRTNIKVDTSKNTYSAYCRFQVNDYDQYYGIFGAYTSESHNAFRLLEGGTNTSLFGYSNTLARVRRFTYNPSSSQSTSNSFEVRLSSSNMYVGGTSATVSDPQYGTNSTPYLCLFSDREGSNEFAGRIYDFYMYDGDTKIIDLIPCRRNSDNVVGMYDRVSGTFYTNNGTGSFVASAPWNYYTGVPEYTLRNGELATQLHAASFYFGNYNINSSSHLGKYFKSGKQYKFDFWLDADDIYYTEGSKNVPGGLRVNYTDGTFTYLTITGDRDNPKGFQHVVYYSDPTKTIQGIGIAYNIAIGAYYRSDSSITEVKDVDVQKCGIVEAPWLVDTNALLGTASQYDTNIYEEPDGSRWIRIFHHANPSSTNLFDSTDTFTTHVYKDANRWFDVSVCNQLSSWELMVKQKTSNSATLQKYRWKQYVNPMLATSSDVTTDKVIYDTSTGYTSCAYKGLFKLNSNTYLTQGDWWFGAIGCWTSYNSGIPGWNQQTISETGFMDLYVRIDDTFKKETNIYDNKIECSSLIEI